MAGFCKDSRIVCRKSVLFLITGLFHFAKLRLFCFDLFNPCIRDMDWRQVRIWEIPVVFGILFGTHCIGIFFVVIPAACLLCNCLAFFDQFNLTLSFAFDCSGNGFERVQVLHLCSGTEFFCSHFTDRKVNVCTHGTFLKFTVGYTEILHHAAELFQISDNFLGASHIRFGYDLDQWNTASVVVYQ